MKSNRALQTVIRASLLGLAALLVACGSSSAPVSPAPTAPVLTATTTLQAETSNNTSAADSFARQTNGNVGATNVSKGSRQSRNRSALWTNLAANLQRDGEILFQ
jgi:hypothetical protein